MADLVIFKASKEANTTVRVGGARTGGVRYPVYTNPDSEEFGELTLERNIAEQLERAKVGEITGPAPEQEEEGSQTAELKALGSTIDANAADRREEFASDDDSDNSRVTGADTRDTTAFERAPLENYGGTTEAGTDGLDAAPINGEAPVEGKRKRRQG